jgi:hypothetical protein
VLPPIDDESRRLLGFFLSRMMESANLEGVGGDGLSTPSVKYMVNTTPAEITAATHLDNAAIERAISRLHQNNFLKPLDNGYLINYTIAANARCFKRLTKTACQVLDMESASTGLPLPESD